jgi:hypothetical protein
VGPRAVLDAVVKRKIPNSAGNRIHQIAVKTSYKRALCDSAKLGGPGKLIVAKLTALQLTQSAGSETALMFRYIWGYSRKFPD